MKPQPQTRTLFLQLKIRPAPKISKRKRMQLRQILCKISIRPKAKMSSRTVAVANLTDGFTETRVVYCCVPGFVSCSLLCKPFSVRHRNATFLWVLGMQDGSRFTPLSFCSELSLSKCLPVCFGQLTKKAKSGQSKSCGVLNIFVSTLGSCME